MYKRRAGALRGAGKSYGVARAGRHRPGQLRSGELLACSARTAPARPPPIGLLLGLVRIDAGDVELFGMDPQRIEARRHIGVMLQDAQLPKMTLAGRRADPTGHELPAPRSVVESAELAGVVRLLLKRPLRQALRRQQRRVQFALRLCGRPKLLFLDEPTVGMDIEARGRNCGAAIRHLVAEGNSVVLTTHYLEEAGSAGRPRLRDGAQQGHQRRQRRGLACAHRAPARVVLDIGCRWRMLPHGRKWPRRASTARSPVAVHRARGTAGAPPLAQDASCPAGECAPPKHEAFTELTRYDNIACRRAPDEQPHRPVDPVRAPARPPMPRPASSTPTPQETHRRILRYLRSPGFMLPTLLFPTVFYLMFSVLLGHGTPAGAHMLARIRPDGVMAPGLFGFGVSLALERDGGLLTSSARCRCRRPLT